MFPDILTPPAQAADVAGLLAYLRPFGIDPLPPFPSKVFAHLSLLRSFPPFPPKAFCPPEIFSLFLPKMFSPLSLLRSFPPSFLRSSPFSSLRSLPRDPFPPKAFPHPEIFSLVPPKIFSPLSRLRSFPLVSLSPLRPSPVSSPRSSPFPREEMGKIWGEKASGGESEEMVEKILGRKGRRSGEKMPTGKGGRSWGGKGRRSQGRKSFRGERGEMISTGKEGKGLGEEQGEDVRPKIFSPLSLLAFFAPGLLPFLPC